MAMPRRHWTDMTWPEIAAADTAAWVAVLPVAAVEQHGPHLPLGTDSYIAEGYLARALELLPDDLPVTFLPLQTVGKSNEHVQFPGTLSLEAYTAMASWVEIGASLHRAGIKKVVIANSHGGNVSIIDIVARELRVRFGMLVVACSWHRLGYPPGLFSDEELRLGIHGGDIETSLMLAFRPDLVRMDEAARFPSLAAALEEECAVLRATQPVGFGWMAQDLNPAGVVGDASAALAEKGRAAADHGARAFVELLRDVASFDPGHLSAGPAT